MSTITLPNIRVSSDLQVRVRLKDGGVAIDWSTLSNIKACIYSDAQRALAGRCAFSIDEEDNTLLVCTYAANKPQYLGVNRIVISAKYMGETKTYDKPAFSFVRWTADQEGEEITIDDPDVDVEIDVEDISSSILQEAVDAANTAAERANDAAEAAEHMVDIHTGPQGKSAYEVAVDEGYVGTEEQWLASLKGDTGETPDITIGTVTTVAPGTPAAATMTGTPEDPVLNLTIPQGAVGATPAFTVGTVTTGAPGSSVIVTISGTAEAPVLNVTIPQGMQGNTGSSVDYPYELVNNLTTNDATKGLSAAQGVVLAGQVSQLELEVDDLRDDVGERSVALVDLCGEDDFIFANTAIVAQEGVTGFGGTSSSSSFSATPYINISDYAGGKLRYTKCLVPSTAGTGTKRTGTVFYSGPTIEEAISGDVTTATGDSYSLQETEIDIPATAKYVRFCCNASLLSSEDWYAKVNEIGEYNSGIGKELEDAEKETHLMLGRYTPAQSKTIPWSSIVQGSYWNLVGGEAGLVTANGYFANGKLFSVNPGQKIYVSVKNSIITDGESTAAFSCYDNDGLPVLNGGTVARLNWSGADSYVNNGDGTTSYVFTIPANCTQIGLYYKTEQINFVIDVPESLVYSETLDQHILDVSGGGDTTAADSAKYYLKGASPKSFSKKVCIIAAGQSNIDGRDDYADMPAEIKSAQPITNCNYVKNSESDAFAPLNITGKWAFDLVTYYNIALGREFYVIKWTVGGTSIDPEGEGEYHWTADYEELSSESKSLLRSFEKSIRNHIATDGNDFDIRAMLWHQGEGDRGSLGTGTADRYYDNLRNMVSYIRGIVGNERLPIVTATISENSTQYDATVHAAQVRLASEDPYFVLIDMSGAPLKDNFHFNATASVYLGQMAYNALIDLGVITGTKLTPVRPW